MCDVRITYVQEVEMLRMFFIVTLFALAPPQLGANEPERVCIDGAAYYAENGIPRTPVLRGEGSVVEFLTCFEAGIGPEVKVHNPPLPLSSLLIALGLLGIPVLLTLVEMG